MNEIEKLIADLTYIGLFKCPKLGLQRHAMRFLVTEAEMNAIAKSFLDDGKIFTGKLGDIKLDINNKAAGQGSNLRLVYDTSIGEDPLEQIEKYRRPNTWMRQTS